MQTVEDILEEARKEGANGPQPGSFVGKLRVQSVEESLTAHVEQLFDTIAEFDRTGKLTHSHNGVPYKPTRVEVAEYRAKAEALMMALLTVAAGSSYFSNTVDNLRGAFQRRAIERYEEGA